MKRMSGLIMKNDHIPVVQGLATLELQVNDHVLIDNCFELLRTCSVLVCGLLCVWGGGGGGGGCYCHVSLCKVGYEHLSLSLSLSLSPQPNS